MIIKGRNLNYHHYIHLICEVSNHLYTFPRSRRPLQFQLPPAHHTFTISLGTLNADEMDLFLFGPLVPEEPLESFEPLELFDFELFVCPLVTSTDFLWVPSSPSNPVP
jgi:hypothetical protein